MTELRPLPEISDVRELYQGGGTGHDFQRVFNERGEDFDRFIKHVEAEALRRYAQERFLAYLLNPDLHWTEQPRESVAQDYAKRALELRTHADLIDPTHG